MKKPFECAKSRTIRLLQKAVVTALLAPLLVIVFPQASAEAAPRVALVTRTVPAPGADQPYIDHLRSRGWDVTLVDDDRVRANGKAAVAGYDLVVISSSIFPARVAWRLRKAPEPILVAEPQLFRNFHFTDTNPANRGFTKSSRSLTITSPGNTLAAGLRGEVVVSTSAKSMNYGTVGSDAVVIATANDAPNQAVIFSYHNGARLASGERATARRVGFYMSQTLPGFANRDGWALFDAAAAWLTPAAPDPDAPDPVDPNDSIAPATGALLGANISNEGGGSRYDSVIDFENLVGRDIAVINRFHEFSAGLTSNFYWDRRHIEDGRTVMISWRATDNPGSVNGSPDPQRARKITNGQFNQQIDAMATALRDLEAPVLLRFNWEMDQDRGDPQYIGTPAEFIAAWRYVYNRFKQRGADNVEWVWSPRARSFAKNVGQTYYPGFNFVDWVGGSAVPINSFEDPRTIYNAWNTWASNIGKPQLLWIGLRENPNNSRWKANFFDDLRMVTAGEWVGVKALIYYNSNSPLGFDYTTDTTPQSQNAFRRLACDPHYTTTDSC